MDQSRKDFLLDNLQITLIPLKAEYKILSHLSHCYPDQLQLKIDLSICNAKIEALEQQIIKTNKP